MRRIILLSEDGELRLSYDGANDTGFVTGKNITRTAGRFR